MTIDRRTFLLGTGLAATVPVFAGLVSLPAMSQRLEARPPDELPPANATGPGIRAEGVVFGIAGWGPGDKAPDADTVLFSVNQAWMSAWR
jgi:hypothetical protein